MTLMIGWTTVATREEAEVFARGLVEAELAVCVQIDAAMTSVYRWQGKMETTQEVRLWVKFLSGRAMELELWLKAKHPYATPQWVAVTAEIVAEKYLSWATSAPNS